LHLTLAGTWLCGVDSCLKYHFAPRLFERRQFILYLRRFSSYADRRLRNVLVRRAPLNTPVVFLVTPNSQIRDWSPFQFVALQPPVQLVSSQGDWEGSARRLIGLAERIVIELSDETASIQLEERMIEEAGRWNTTVVLTSRNHDYEDALRERLGRKGARVLGYSTSGNDPRREMYGCCGGSCLFLVVCVFSLAGAQFLVERFTSLKWSSLVDPFTHGIGLVLGLLALLVLAVLDLVFCRLLIGFDGDVSESSRKEIGEALRQERKPQRSLLAKMLAERKTRPRGRS
jgi:hypothetical protein